MRFTRVREEEPRLVITPLIDIVFLLLIFFMLTSHFHIASGLPINLPEVAGRAYDSGKERIIIVMDSSGSTYFGGERIHLKELEEKLRTLVEKDGLVHLILEADKDVTHGKVVQVMDLAKKAGVPSIIIAARWKSKKVF
jgi:biopolymer transport protein ExbD